MDQLEKRFVIKNSEGIIFEYFFRENKIIEHILGENSDNEIMDNVYTDFYVMMDEQDIVHILCQNTSSDIIYLNNNNSKWEQQTILLSKTPEIYNKHFYLLSSENCTNFFYIIKNKENWLLVHQTKLNDKISEPVVVDYINLSSKPFSICKDGNECIFCFYNKLNLGYTQLGYKIYESEIKRWNNYTFLTSSSANNSTPSVLLDKNNCIHLIYLRQKNQTISIIYQKKLLEKNFYQKWSKESLVENINYSCNSLILMMFDENIWIMWRQNNDIWMSFLTENKDWSKPLRYDFTYFDKLYDIVYYSNVQHEKYRINGNNFIGNIGEKLYLIPINELLEQFKDYVEESAATSQHIEELGNINLYLENVKNFVTKIAQKATQIEKQRNEFQKEVDILKKTNVKLREESINIRNTLDFYDEENKKLLSQLEELQKKVHNYNDLLANKDCEILDNIQKVNNLSETNKNLGLEIKYLKSELEIEKNLPLLKRLFKFKKDK